ncbi:RFC checkpoint protein Rad17 [Coemansia helicoidea]|uniref:RFC checkpoint protein Rad17 n=1 Tax=Coemansia helicoidea TaxID=1286919 RepID=A0ACC1LHM5_9FUNG|nr:RFC checkpoint protein Rad17 [Coemansia helicoidea]
MARRTRLAVVEVSSSPEPEPAPLPRADHADCDDLDMEIEFDSDLEALINEASQPPPPPPERPPKPAAPLDTGRRRALSDRPRFKLARAQAGAESTPAPAAAPGSDEEGQLWWQQHAPATAAELAVHSAKIAQVRGWMEMAADAAAGRGSRGSGFFRILVLEGPAGSGKSTCVRVLARELGLDVLEWINPLSVRLSDAAHQADDAPGVARRFEEFLLQAQRLPSLALQPADGRHREQGRGKLILVDDIPNIGHRDTRESFREALLRFVAIPAHRSFPMVVVVTESFAAQQVLEDDGARRAVRRQRDNDAWSHVDMAVWSAMDVLPAAVHGSPYCQTIRFNAVAPTIVAKALRRILHIRSGRDPAKSAKLAPATAAAVKAIADECQGDLRLAVIKLQLALAGAAPAAGDSPVGRKRRRGAPAAVDAVDGAAAVGLGEARRSALDMFHALGKVMYAKRSPAHTSGGRGRLEADPDEVLDRLPTDLGTFGLYVHENYLDFCSAPGEAAAAAECMSDADALASSGRGAGAADVYAAMVAVRGYMHARGHPLLADGAAEPAVAVRPLDDGRRRAMFAFRKPAFFENYRLRMAHSRLLRDEACAGALRLDALRLPDSRLAPDFLPFWARIAAGRGALLGPGAPARLARLAAPGCGPDALPWRLAAASVRDAQPDPLAAADPQPAPLAEDDIQDYSD